MCSLILNLMADKIDGKEKRQQDLFMYFYFIMDDVIYPSESYYDDHELFARFSTVI